MCLADRAACVVHEVNAREITDQIMSDTHQFKFDVPILSHELPLLGERTYSYEEGVGKKFQDLQKELSLKSLPGTTTKELCAASLEISSSGVESILTEIIHGYNVSTVIEPEIKVVQLDRGTMPEIEVVLRDGNFHQIAVKEPRSTKKKLKLRSGEIMDVKVTALNYFCDSKGRDLEQLCREQQVCYIIGCKYILPDVCMLTMCFR